MGQFLVGALQVVLGYGTLALLFWAFIDASRFTREQFRATKRMGRVPWLLALGLAIVLTLWLGVFRFADPLGGRSLTWLATVLLLAIYFYDARPRLLRQRSGGG